MLAPSFRQSSEGVSPGDDRGGLADGAGAPYRYGHTAVGWDSFSAWNDPAYAYSLGQINLGNNPLSLLQVVSLLNLNNQAYEMYAHSPINRPSRYYPKVYIGTTKTISTSWLYNDENGWKNTQKMDWPQAFQGPQKGIDLLYLCPLSLNKVIN